MGRSAFVGALGCSTIYQRIRKESCLADLLANEHTDLVLAVDLTVAHELAPAALIHGMGVPRKHYLTVIHRQETLCGSPGSREEILALCCNKKYMPLDALAWVRGTTLNCIIPPLRWHS